MIELQTGLPGAGKTLYTICRVKEWAERENRPVYYDGIKGLKLPWIQHDGQKWFDLPANSIMVIDEAQRLFRPRGRTAEPPDYVTQLETHRHLGIDLVFITQNAMLIDSHVRRLCERHWHAMRNFGLKRATVHEFPAGVRENADKVRKDSIRHEFRYPRQAFEWYESAEAHTHKAHLPAKVWIMLGAIVVAAVAIAVAVHRLNPKNKAAQIAHDGGADLPSAGSAGGAPAQAGHDKPHPLTAAEYVGSFSPRVPGLAYTAPAYDDVTKPTQAPYPAACIASASRCVCASQQGTRLDVPDKLCRDIAQGGFFVAWNKPADQSVVTPATVPQPLPQQPGQIVAYSMNGGDRRDGAGIGPGRPTQAMFGGAPADQQNPHTRGTP